MEKDIFFQKDLLLIFEMTIFVTLIIQLRLIYSLEGLLERQSHF
jgi:hypothetical protein